MRNVLLVSSDGHATARMDDYGDYMEPAFREEFADFCAVYRERGSHNWEPPSMKARMDAEEIDDWVRTVMEPGRLEGHWNVERRLVELDREGMAGEVLIPDFGLPFELYEPGLAAQLGYPSDQLHADAANRAYNRWLVDFCSTQPERFAGMAMTGFSDVEAAIAEIRWAREAGLRGVMLPIFEEKDPLFGAAYDPIWSTLEELDMVVNSHISISSTSTRGANWSAPAPHPACVGFIRRGAIEFDCHQVLDHLIWGGVLERHPALKVVFTEQGSGWIPGRLAGMDHSYSGSYTRRDIREYIKLMPSDYFARQCWIGSSLLSRAEVASRHLIGVDKMMVGVDYPHHEGTWKSGNREYLQATFGAAGVPEDDARKMLGETAAMVYGFDLAKLQPIVDRIGPQPEEILTPPTEDKFPRGDVHKPLSGALV